MRLELIDYLTHRVPFGRPVMDVTGCARIGLRHHRRPARGAGKPHPRLCSPAALICCPRQQGLLGQFCTLTMRHTILVAQRNTNEADVVDGVLSLLQFAVTVVPHQLYNCHHRVRLVPLARLVEAMRLRAEFPYGAR